jgi:hypothetical protein
LNLSNPANMEHAAIKENITITLKLGKNGNNLEE